MRIQQQAFDTDKLTSLWEQIVLAKYQTTASAPSIVELIDTIDDHHEKQLAMLMLLSLLRTGQLPPNPYPDPASPLDPIEPAPPAAVSPSATLPSRVAPPLPPPPSDPGRRQQEAAWRRQIETARTSIIATLDKLTDQVAMLDDKHKSAVYLALADNYDKLLDPLKAAKSVDHAAHAMQALYRYEHSRLVAAWNWLLSNLPGVLIALLSFVLMLHHDLFKKVDSHLTGQQLLHLWPSLADAVGKPLPAETPTAPATLPGTGPAALAAPASDVVLATTQTDTSSSPDGAQPLPDPAHLPSITVSQDAPANAGRPA